MSGLRRRQGKRAGMPRIKDCGIKNPPLPKRIVPEPKEVSIPANRRSVLGKGGELLDEQVALVIAPEDEAEE